jgi:hypothetical protein
MRRRPRRPRNRGADEWSSASPTTRVGRRARRAGQRHEDLAGMLSHKHPVHITADRVASRFARLSMKACRGTSAGSERRPLRPPRTDVRTAPPARDRAGPGWTRRDAFRGAGRRQARVALVRVVACRDFPDFHRSARHAKSDTHHANRSGTAIPCAGGRVFEVALQVSGQSRRAVARARGPERESAGEDSSRCTIGSFDVCGTPRR